MNFCIYSGTFNPIHNAHIGVALGVLQYTDTEKIILIPSKIPPHKNEEIIAPNHRLNMVKLAIEDYPDFEVNDIELTLPGKSYSYNTVMKIKQLFKINDKINFIIGTDAFEKLDSWYHAQNLVEEVHFIVVPRCKNFNIELSRKKIKLPDISYSSLELPFLDISSTKIRYNLKHNLPINSLISEKVLNYIKDNNLYS